MSAQTRLAFDAFYMFMFTLCLRYYSVVDLRNSFNIWPVHGIMNLLDLLQVCENQTNTMMKQRNGLTTQR